MKYLPIFIDLKGRRVLVIGGGEVATRKISLLCEAGAQVYVVAETLTETLQSLSMNSSIQWLAKQFAIEQLTGMMLVVAATHDPVLNATVFVEATHQHIWVNTVDDIQHCSFIFPSIIDRSPLMVAISSGGTAPVLSRLLREKLEALLPFSLGRLAQLAGKWRKQVQQKIHAGSRRSFWEQLFQGSFSSWVAIGNEPQAEHVLQQALINGVVQQGEVALVGAGPGDPGLLTLKALQVIQQADEVLYDHLVSEEILALIRRDAKKHCVGKRAASPNHTTQQENINQTLIKLSREGKRVVRLKGGDPLVFARGGEEIMALAQAGVPYQIVPGITAAVGAMAYAGIPFTHRDYAQRVIFITGHCQTGKCSQDWVALAQTQQTLVVYMGVLRAAEIMHELITHGRSNTTPIAVINHGTRINQRVLTGQLDELEQLVQGLQGPTLLVIGEVVALRQQLAWFQQTERTNSHTQTALLNEI